MPKKAQTENAPSVESAVQVDTLGGAPALPSDQPKENTPAPSATDVTMTAAIVPFVPASPLKVKKDDALAKLVTEDIEDVVPMSWDETGGSLYFPNADGSAWTKEPINPRPQGVTLGQIEHACDVLARSGLRELELLSKHLRDARVFQKMMVTKHSELLTCKIKTLFRVLAERFSNMSLIIFPAAYLLTVICPSDIENCSCRGGATEVELKQLGVVTGHFIQLRLRILRSRTMSFFVKTTATWIG